MIAICNEEELALLPKWFVEIIGMHCEDSLVNIKTNNIVVELRKRVQGFETDVVVTCRSGSRRVLIGFELKKDNLDEAVKQAVERRALFHYFYVVLHLPVRAILSKLRYHHEAFENGIGFVSAVDDAVVIRSYSRRHWRESASYTYTLLSYMKEDGSDEAQQNY